MNSIDTLWQGWRSSSLFGRFLSVCLWFRKRSFSWRNQRDFLSHVTHLLGEGVGVCQAVDLLATTANGGMQTLARATHKALSEGKCFADGLWGWYPPHVVTLIAAGERGNAFLPVLQAASQTLQGRHRLLFDTVQVLAYPLLVLAMALGVSIFMLHSVFQSFLGIKALALWPPMGQSLYHFATWLERWGIFALFALLLLGGGGLYALRTVVGPWRQAVGGWPLLHLYRQVVAGHALQQLALLMRHGASFREALVFSQSGASVYWAWQVRGMLMRLDAGCSDLSEVLGERLLSKADGLQLRVVARGRHFALALGRMGERLLEQTQASIRRGLRVLASVLLVLAACLAAYMILAVYGVGGVMGV